MRSICRLHSWIFALDLALSATVAFAQDRPADNDYQPQIGQPGTADWTATALEPR